MMWRAVWGLSDGTAPQGWQMSGYSLVMPSLSKRLNVHLKQKSQFPQTEQNLFPQLKAKFTSHSKLKKQIPTPLIPSFGRI